MGNREGHGSALCRSVSELLWQPMGAGRDAYITVDRLGAPRCAGGFCATTRDLARIGLLLAEGGSYGGKQIVPDGWIEDIWTNGDPDAWNEGDFVKYFPNMNIHYRNKWYVLQDAAPIMFEVGVFGQNVFIDRKNQIVIAKFSSQALPMDEKRILSDRPWHRSDPAQSAELTHATLDSADEAAAHRCREGAPVFVAGRCFNCAQDFLNNRESPGEGLELNTRKMIQLRSYRRPTVSQGVCTP